MSDEHTPAAALRTTTGPPARGQLVSVLLRDGALSEAQARHAERVRDKLDGRRPFVPLLLELGLVSPERLRAALRTHRLELRIGELLVEFGHLREADVVAALGAQEASADRERKLGEILVEQGLLGAQELASVLSSQLGIPCVDAGSIEPETQLLEGVPLETCRRHRFLPLRREDGRVCVAFADPLDKDDASAAQAIFGPAVAPWIASSTAIEEALGRLELAARVSADTEAGERAATATLHELLAAAARSGASELHFESGARRVTVRARRDGVLTLLRELPSSMGPPLLRRLAFEAGVVGEEGAPYRRGRLRFDHEGQTFEMGAAFLATIGGESATLRLRRPHGQSRSLADLGLLPSLQRRLVERVLDAPGVGLLIAGPTASGRGTTLRACVAAVSQPEVRIVLVGDGSDAPLAGVSHLSDTTGADPSFEDRIVGALAQLPDVIAIDGLESDDQLTALLRARRAGPRLIAAIEAEDAADALGRVRRASRDASNPFVAALGQRLVRRVCSACALPLAPTAAQIRALGATGDALASSGFRRGRGCARCSETGYAGRIGVFELLGLTDAGRGLRGRGSAGSPSVEGAMTLLEDGLVKAARGLTTIEELVRVVPRSAAPRPLAELERISDEEC